MGDAKWIVNKHEKVSQPWIESLNCGAIRKQFYYSHTFCTPGILTTTSPTQEHWFPESRTANWENARGAEEQIDSVKEFFTVHPDACVR